MGRPKVSLLATWCTIEGGHGDSGFRNPSALAANYEGNLLVADTGNHRFVKLDRDGRRLWAVGAEDSAGKPRPGLHAHGYGLALNRLDESIVYVQGDHLIFSYRVER